MLGTSPEACPRMRTKAKMKSFWGSEGETTGKGRTRGSEVGEELEARAAGAYSLRAVCSNS